MPVHWLIAAAQSLRAAVHADAVRDPAAFDALRARLDATLQTAFPGQVVLVRDRLSGYRPFDGLAILLVEVQPDPTTAPAVGLFPSPGTFIVKAAFDARAADLVRELAAWDTARPPHLRSDGVFVSLDPVPARGAGPPVALVYGDATAVLGERNVLSLEEAALRACRFGQPRPASVGRLLATLYDRLDTHFYGRSFLSPPADYLADDARPRLADVLLRWQEPPDPALAGPNDDARRQLRRETLALLAAAPDEYADPVDHLAGVREAGGPAPAVLRGFCHGDLHARNVQVAVVDDDATACAVFDYDRMRPDNFLAWDFIKLELELAVQLLDADGAADRLTFTRQALTVWRLATVHPDDGPADHRLVKRAAELPPSLGRLAESLVVVRRLAHKHLGTNRGRGYDWQAEYDFLMTWYAVRAGLYPSYTERQTVAALVAAGVSARRRQPGHVTPTADRAPGETSHRPRYLYARGLARGGDPAGGVARLAELAKEYPHALEVDEELALGRIELGDFAAAEAGLQRVADRYRHTTAETPARLGALWKRRAVAASPADPTALRHALEWYRRAESLGGDYFPAVNVASLLLLLGDRAAARAQAARVLTLLDRTDPAADPFWPHATRGEVALLAGDDPAAALAHYTRAAADPACTPRDRASMRRQLVLLRPHLDPPTRAALADAALDELFAG